MENFDLETIEPPAPPEEEKPGGGGCLSEMGWFTSSFVLPFASLSFYRRATRRSTGNAALFFILFMGVITLLPTIAITYQMSRVTGEIRQVFTSGTIPEITIRKGIASARGAQPAVLLDRSGTFVAIDTTGMYRSIDRTRYNTGFLLTRTELHILSNTGEYQRLPLAQVQELLQQDPLVINAETMARYWQNLTPFISIGALVGLGIWNLVVRFAYLAALAVVVWAGIALFRSKVPYGFVLSVGIYAFVPVILLIYVLGRVGVTFFLLQTLILLVMWGIGLYAALVKDGWDLLGPERPLRAWRAWVGVPFLVILALDVVFSWPNGGSLDLIAGALTGIAIVAAGMFSLPRGEDDTQDAGTPASPPTSPSSPASGDPNQN